MTIKSDCVVLPVITQSMASGFPSPAEEYNQTPINLNQHLISHPEASFILKAVGNNLQHLGIFDNDYLVVDRSLTPAHQNIIIIVLNGQLTIKQLLKTPSNTWVLHGELGATPELMTKKTDIWGVVKWVLHKV